MESFLCSQNTSLMKRILKSKSTIISLTTADTQLPQSRAGGTDGSRNEQNILSHWNEEHTVRIMQMAILMSGDIFVWKRICEKFLKILKEFAQTKDLVKQLAKAIQIRNLRLKERPQVHSSS